jgi:hypothetical protein
VNGACTCTHKDQSDPACLGGYCQQVGSQLLCATSTQISVPADFSGRFWGRTGCTQNGSSLNCVTGDCQGAADCYTGGTADNATLWEQTLTGAQAKYPGSSDNYDVSLVSGYNIPLQVRAQSPSDAPGWMPSTSYVGGANQSVINASAGSYSWLFNNVGTSGTSGTTKPGFSTVLHGQVADGPNIIWSTTTSVCQSGYCANDLLVSCPSLLRVDNPAQSCTAGLPSDPKCNGGPCDSNGTCVVACTVPANYCAASSTGICTPQNNSFYLCLNKLSKEVDPFGQSINLESANAGTAICFSSADCQPGTTCLMNPSFTAASNVTWPAGAGLCLPGNGTTTQNGGCTSSSYDGKLCPADNFTFPFPDYTCATVTNDGSGTNVQVCIPPITPSATGAAAFGSLVWNANNFTPVVPQVSCTADSGCAAGQYCLETTVRTSPGGATAVNECTGSGDTCQCNSVKSCVTSADCTANTQCLNKQGLPSANCGTGAGQELCLCQTDALYTGVCGATNVNWTNAIDQVTGSSPNYLVTFKNACPAGYSYQFDDQASDWSCYSTADQLVNYTVSFCATGP